MTKILRTTHYEQIAESIRQSYLDALQFNMNNEVVRETATHIANNLAMMFKHDNSKFNEDKFLEACGTQNWELYGEVDTN